LNMEPLCLQSVFAWHKFYNFRLLIASINTAKENK
jgi:hypothetical protein